MSNKNDVCKGYYKVDYKDGDVHKEFFANNYKLVRMQASAFDTFWYGKSTIYMFDGREYVEI